MSATERNSLKLDSSLHPLGVAIWPVIYSAILVLDSEEEYQAARASIRFRPEKEINTVLGKQYGVLLFTLTSDNPLLADMFPKCMTFFMDVDDAEAAIKTVFRLRAELLRDLYAPKEEEEGEPEEAEE